MAIGDVIVGIDIGTSKVCTVVGEVNNFGQIETICSTSCKCAGLKKGKIINEEEISLSIAKTIKDAEEEANFKINSAYITIPGKYVTIVQNSIVKELKDRFAGISLRDVQSAIIQAKDIDGLEKYYAQLLKDCQEVTNLSGLNPESINNPAIYSLLASKYYLATEKGIEFDLDIFMDLTSIDMKIYEFCRILGILLDNAIQATQECEEKHIKVTIRKDNRCKRQLLIVENTYKEKDIDTEKIFEKGYSTKEGNTGLGLWEVRQILFKNTNLNLFTSKDDTYFKQQLEIYKS